MFLRRVLNKIKRTLKLTPKADYTAWKNVQDSNMYKSSSYALEKLQSSSAVDKMIFHSFWNGPIGEKQAFSLKSCLCTQNMQTCEVWLWLDKENGYNEYKSNPIIQELTPYIRVLCFDYEAELKKTKVSNQLSGYNFKGDHAHKADAFRFITLNNYGGVYFDLDIMFLKNFQPLLTEEFCYAWEDQQYANSAILGLRKKSMLSDYLLNKCATEGFFYPWTILNYGDAKLSGMYVYPCSFFDPIWQKNTSVSKQIPIGSFNEFFKEFSEEFIKRDDINSFNDFFKGGYAFHWHNQWKTTEYTNSYFGLFNMEMGKILKSRS